MKPRAQRKASQENRPTDKKQPPVGQRKRTQDPGSKIAPAKEKSPYQAPPKSKKPKDLPPHPDKGKKYPEPEQRSSKTQAPTTINKKTSSEALAHKAMVTIKEHIEVEAKVEAKVKENALGTRLNKTLADAGVCSRRKADELIAAGAVAIDGITTAQLGTRVFPGQRVTVNGKEILETNTTLLYIILNKPIHVVCTVQDPEGRPTVLDLLPDNYKAARLYPVGRLDYFSEGLLLLTNDGELTHRLTHPSHHLEKIYHVLIREDITDIKLQAIRTGMTLAEGEKLAPIPVKILSTTSRGTLLELRLQQGINRQIRRMCRDLALTILTLQRIAQGPLQLGTLASGESRHLNNNELINLKVAVKLY